MPAFVYSVRDQNTGKGIVNAHVTGTVKWTGFLSSGSFPIDGYTDTGGGYAFDFNSGVTFERMDVTIEATGYYTQAIKDSTGAMWGDAKHSKSLVPVPSDPIGGLTGAPPGQGPLASLTGPLGAFTSGFSTWGTNVGMVAAVVIIIIAIVVIIALVLLAPTIIRG